MGYFVSVLRDRIATFHAQEAAKEPQKDTAITGAAGVSQLSASGVIDGISINDLRKNLSAINQYMEEACRVTGARYGVELDAALITSIDAPTEVDTALASINTTQNEVAAQISQAKADASQKLKMADKAVEIAQNLAAADAAPILELGNTLKALYVVGKKPALETYLRNAFLPLREKAAQTILNA
jgi:regulator of protease activity HflC (stomatin/prohibitin superfamily)